MKQLRNLLLLAACACTATAYAQAEITWIDGTTHDFGAFTESAEHSVCTFRYTNTGNEDLVITGARASCGCTTPRYGTRPIAPGDTASITVAFDSQGRPGRFSKAVFIDANTTPRRSVLTIKGVVIGAPETIARRFPVDLGPLKMAHSTVLLGEIARRHVKSVFADGYNGSTDTITPAIAYAPRWLEATPTPRAVPPGERLSLSLYITADRIPQYGANTDSLRIIPDSRHPERQYAVGLSVNLREDFSKMDARALARAPQARVDTQLLNIPGDTHTAAIRLSNHGGGDPLVIRRIYAQSPAIHVSAPKKDKVKKGHGVDIAVTADPEALPQDGTPLDTRLYIITNDPSNDVIAVRVTAALL